MLITRTLPSILNMRTIAPFIAEGSCLLIIFVAAVLLTAPLVSHFNHLLVKTSKDISDTKLTDRVINPPGSEEANPCPTAVSPSVKTASKSPSERSVKQPTSPVPLTNGSSDDEIGIDGKSGALMRSNGYNNGFGTVSYSTYRHKLIEESLQKQYGGGYAPGDVILNLIQLNTADSACSVTLARKYDAISFFDHLIVNSSAVLSPSFSGPPDPLTHFIPRNPRKQPTVETHTETFDEPSETSVITSRPTTPSSCQRMQPKFAGSASSRTPFVTPVHSQAPITTPARVEQLFRRNDDAEPDVVSRTHVEAQEYLSRITRNDRRHEVALMPSARSALKKSRPPLHTGRNKPYRDGFGERNRRELSIKAELRNLSTSKPTVWHN